MSLDYLIGSIVRLQVTIADAQSLALVDPGGVVLKIRKPDQTLTTLTYGIDLALVKAATGDYYADVLLNQAGHWHWRYEVSSPHTGVAEGSLRVTESLVL